MAIVRAFTPSSGGGSSATSLNRVVAVSGVYPARPSTGYTDFLGIADPTAFMQTGDTWTELPPTAPNAPTIGTATGGNAQASVAFTAPSWNGGASITGYTAKSTPGNITGTGSSSPVTVSGLTNGTAYTFTVHATNSVGNSAESAASNSVTPSAGATVPGAPTIGTATAGNASATVAFTPPASNGGSAITGYTATSSPGGITGTGTSSPVTVSGLTNGTAYTFTVHATNAIGNSAESAASNSVTPSGTTTVPGAPTIGTATAGVTSATITFTPPGSNGGATITSYTATSTPGGITRTVASSPITVTGLTAGTAYTFTVHATNSVGNSSESAASNSVTPTAGGAGGSLPTVTTGTLWGHFKADALGLSDGASVTTWTKSAGSMTGNLTSAGTAPVFKTGQLNGFPSVRLSAGYFDAPSAGTLSQAFTRFVVCRHLSTPGQVVHDLVNSSTAPSTELFFNGFNNDFDLDCGARVYGPAGYLPTNGNVLEAVANGTASIMAVNGENATFTADAGTNTQSGVRVGANTNGDAASIYQGDIFEVVIYSGALSAADRTAVRQYLGTKYGITVT